MVARISEIARKFQSKQFHNKTDDTQNKGQSVIAFEYIQRVKELGLKSFECDEETFNKEYLMVTNLPSLQQSLIYLNDLFLIEERKSGNRILLIHHFNKVDIHKIIEEIEFNEIQFATEKAMQMFIKKQNKIGKEVNEDIGAGEFILALLEKARVSSISDIYISLIGINLIVQYRGSICIEEVARYGIKEAQIIRNMLEYLARQENGTTWYDSKIVVDKQEYRINFFETTQGFACTIRSYSNHEFDNKITLKSLGYTPKIIKIIESICKNKNGFIIYTGQTGHGKTTTQYSNLEALHDDGLKVYSIENPVERRMSFNQIDLSIYETAEDQFKLTSKDALKLLLRAKPDVICVGEARDPEEIRLAYTASITGHLVFLTLHTNNCDTAITRLHQESGLSLPDIQTATRGIIYQYLTRRLCPKCKIRSDNQGHFKAKGCHECDQTGYSRVKIPIVEIMHFPFAKDFNIAQKDTYEYVSLNDSAKEIYDMGLIDKAHHDAVVSGERDPEIGIK